MSRSRSLRSRSSGCFARRIPATSAGARASALSARFHATLTCAALCVRGSRPSRSALRRRDRPPRQDPQSLPRPCRLSGRPGRSASSWKQPSMRWSSPSSGESCRLVRPSLQQTVLRSSSWRTAFLAVFLAVFLREVFLIAIYVRTTPWARRRYWQPVTSKLSPTRAWQTSRLVRGYRTARDSRKSSLPRSKLA